jgi:hypothetical protein
MNHRLSIILITILLYGCNADRMSKGNERSSIPGNMFEYNSDFEPRWASFENIHSLKGGGGLENNGAKGHPCDSVGAGKSKILLETDGPGIINRIWVTISDRSPKMLRSLVINMYWDNEAKPAVSVPFGDFFGMGLGKTTSFENDLFANPEGRSFNCFIQMPFRKAAKIELVNQSDTMLPMLFYDIDLQLMKNWNKDFLYFHSYWHRDTATILEKDFEILPEVTGKGRFLGTNISVNANPVYKDCWWGEGEVKVYLDGDRDHPTLAGTGTEDYIGTAWGQGKFCTRYTGCLVADSKNLQWAFFRYHIADPIYFQTDCRVTIQQMGGNSKERVIDMLNQKIALVPVSIFDAPAIYRLYKKDSSINLNDPKYPEAWVNFFRSDDGAATAYFYSDKPASHLPPLQPVAIRTWKLKKE